MSMTWSSGLHRGYTGCQRYRHRGDPWDNWCGGDSCDLWLWSCRDCGCNRHRLHWLCRLGRCRLWHKDVASGGSLWCGCWGVWDSDSGLDTAFMQVSSHVAVNSTIAGVYLVAVLGQDMYHCSGDPNLVKGVIHGNWLTSIQEWKRSAMFISLWSEGVWGGINLFMNLKGCWVSVVDFCRNGGPKLVLVKELSRWWELGINWSNSECQEGKLQIGTTVLSTVEHMLHWFYTCLCKSIWLWIVQA